MNDNALKSLWDSTRSLHSRFGTNSNTDEANDAQLRCVAEEHFEFQHAATQSRDLQMFAAGPDHLLWTDVAEAAAEEAVDVIVTMMGVLQNLGVGYETIAKAMYAVAEKNDAKTNETHAVNKNGKIARKE
jgi:hypothetical protein